MSEFAAHRKVGKVGRYRLSAFGIAIMVAGLAASLPYVVSNDPNPFLALTSLFAAGAAMAFTIGGMRPVTRFEATPAMVGLGAGAAIAVGSMVLGLGKLATIDPIPLYAAVSEEFFFRGGLQSTVTKTLKSPIIGIIFSAGLFAMFHWQVYPGYTYSYFYPLVAGLVLAAAYEVTHDLTAPLTAHFMINLLASLG